MTGLTRELVRCTIVERRATKWGNRLGNHALILHHVTLGTHKVTDAPIMIKRVLESFVFFSMFILLCSLNSCETWELFSQVPVRNCLGVISSGNRTEWSPIRFVIIRVINKIGRPRSGSPICLITSMITDRIGRHEVLLPINHNFNKICDI